MNLETICRVCLDVGKQMFDIYTSYYIQANMLYVDMFVNCTKIKPTLSDGLPRLICKDCSKRLKKVYIFNKQCEESNEKLLTNVQDRLCKYDTDVNNDNKNQVINEICAVKEENDRNTLVTLFDEDCKAVIKEGIKIENNFEEANDLEWHADDDDDLMLADIKLKKNLLQEQEYPHEKIKKKRGRKKAVGGLKSKAPHQCDICGKFLSTKSNLKAHKICHTELRPYKCSDCPAAFRGYSALFQHKRIHSGETPYHCEYCSKQFKRRTGLVNHIRIHTGEKLYSCDICFKNFVQSGQLMIHMKRHKGEKTFLCQDCGKGFPLKSDLVVHQRVHNGEKPYLCIMCDKTFATSGNLSIHVRIHKKEIRYRCKHCQRGFVTCSAYNVHLKRHKGQRDYHCECGKTFYTSSALKQHRVVHTGEKKYQCKICNRKFTQTSHLTRHFKKDHAKPNDPLPPSDHYKLIVSDNSNKRVLNCLGQIEEVKCEGL